MHLLLEKAELKEVEEELEQAKTQLKERQEKKNNIEKKLIAAKSEKNISEERYNLSKTELDKTKQELPVKIEHLKKLCAEAIEIKTSMLQRMGVKGQTCKNNAREFQEKVSKLQDSEKNNVTTNKTIENYKNCFIAGRSSNNEKEGEYDACKNCEKPRKDKSAKCGPDELKPFEDAKILQDKIATLEGRLGLLSTKKDESQAKIKDFKTQLASLEKEIPTVENLEETIRGLTEKQTKIKKEIYDFSNAELVAQKKADDEDDQLENNRIQMIKDKTPRETINTIKSLIAFLNKPSAKLSNDAQFLLTQLKGKFADFDEKRLNAQEKQMRFARVQARAQTFLDLEEDALMSDRCVVKIFDLKKICKIFASVKGATKLECENLSSLTRNNRCEHCKIMKIKNLYRRASLSLHPDKQLGKSKEETAEAEAKFKLMGGLYETLQTCIQ